VAKELTEKQELEALKKKCLKIDGTPRKSADKEDLFRILELQANVPVEMTVEDFDNLKQLQAEYEDLRKKCIKGNDKPDPDATIKDLTRLISLKDMLGQNEPRSERIKFETQKDKSLKITVAKGPPVVLQGKDEKDNWVDIANIMFQGTVTLKKDKKYSALRLARGTRHPQYIEVRPVVMAPPGRNEGKVFKA